MDNIGPIETIYNFVYHSIFTCISNKENIKGLTGSYLSVYDYAYL